MGLNTTKMPMHVTFIENMTCLNMNLGIRNANESCSGSIRCVLGANWLFGSAFGSSKNLLCMFKIIFINLPNVASICIQEAFGKHSRSIRCVLKTFWKHASSSKCILSIRRVLKAFGNHMKSKVNMREVFGLF